MNRTLRYLKTYRERLGISLQDMAELVGIHISSLSKMEKGKRQIQVHTLLSYHFILNIPVEQLLKNDYKNILEENLNNALQLKDRLLDAMTAPEVSDRVQGIDTVIDQLREQQKQYGV